MISFDFLVFYLQCHIDEFSARIKGLGIFSNKAQMLRYELSLFAPEDEGKTEEATEHRKSKARKEDGKVVNSNEINQTAVLISGIIMIALLFPGFAKEMANFAADVFHRIGDASERFTAASLTSAFGEVLVLSLKFSVPVLGVAFLTALIANVSQAGFLFTIKNIKPDLSKVAPSPKNFKERVFFSKQNMQKLVILIFKLAVIGFITFLTVRSYYPKILVTIMYGLSPALMMMARIVLEMLFKVAAFLIIVSIVDYILQRKQHLEQLKMSKQEVKEEHKEMEGDPQVKSRMMEQMQEMSSRNTAQAVAEADVVITNPTHFAVVLKYDEGIGTAPRVTAKGADKLALRIKELARESSVEIVENVELARTLYYDVDIGEEIPQRFYKIVSLIFSNIARMKAKKARAVS